MLDSGFSDFFRQIPPILIVMFCGSSITLIAVIAIIVNTRTRKAQRVENVPTRASVATMNYSASPSSSTDGGDMPDLDDLLQVTPPPAPPAKPKPRGAITITTATGETAEVVEVITVLRDVGDGSLLIQIGEQVHRNPPALADAEFKRRFNSTIRDLYQSIGDTSLTKRATGEFDAAPPASSTATPTPPPRPMPRTPPPAGTPVPGDLPKFKMPDVAEKPKRGRRPPQEPIPEINIAEAIEEFLQFKLSMTSEFADRSIHVRPALGGGLRIDVDNQSYDMVSDVEDPEVRAFLQATIEEWQSRQ